MADTPNTLTINVLNNIGLVMDQLNSVFANAQLADTQWEKGNLGAFVNAFTTSPLTADGLQEPVTVDPPPPPVATDPVYVTKYSTLSRAISPNDWTLAIEFLQQFILFMQGSQASFPSAPTLLASFVMNPPRL